MLKPQRIQELQALLSCNNHSLVLLHPEVVPFCIGSFWENPHQLRILGVRDQIVQKAYAGAAMEKYAATHTGLSHKSWLSWEVMQTAPHCLGWEAEQKMRSSFFMLAQVLAWSSLGGFHFQKEKGKKNPTPKPTQQQWPEGGQYCLCFQIIPYIVAESCCNGNRFHSWRRELLVLIRLRCVSCCSLFLTSPDGSNEHLAFPMG